LTKLHQAIVDGTPHLSIYEGRKILNAQALENSVQDAICDYLKLHKIPFSRTDATEAYNRKGQRIKRVGKGWPDVTACLPGGRIYAIEVKKAVGGVLSYDQALTLDSIRRMGGLIVIARSIDCVIAAMVGGVRPCDLAEIEKAIARGERNGGK
jgi:hypothetical protein